MVVRNIEFDPNYNCKRAAVSCDFVPNQTSNNRRLKLKITFKIVDHVESYLELFTCRSNNMNYF